MEDKITEKQFDYIYDVLGKQYNIDEKQLKDITKKEAKGIIERNIIKNMPLLQWYIWHDGNDFQVRTCMYIENRKNSFEKPVIDKVFLKKRQAEKYIEKIKKGEIEI